MGITTLRFTPFSTFIQELFQISLENAVLFMSYGICQKGICNLTRKDKVNALNSFENALAGSAAAFFASLVLCPTELVKCRLQSAREISNKSNMYLHQKITVRKHIKRKFF